MKNDVEGVVSDDPLQDVPKGFKLRVERRTFPPQLVANSAGDWSSFGGVVLKLTFGTAANSRIMGSGVMVAPGVALIATHVIEPELDDLLSERIGALAMAITPSGLEIWRIYQITLQDRRDVALVTLRRASKLAQNPTLSHAVLTTRTPKVGEVISICGFVAGELNHRDGVIVGNMHSSIGRVSQLFLDGRDRCMLPGPCFAVEVGTPGGLSGGPAFDETGRLIGLLSSSTGTNHDDVSFVSMITPILCAQFSPCWPPNLVPGPTRLLDYPEQICEIQGREHISVLNGNYQYRAWS